MKLTVFGATGGTGQHVVRQALAAGYRVTAVARRSEAVEASGANLRVVTAELTDAAVLRDAVAGADTVISALGARAMKEHTTVYSEGTAAILEAMAANGIRRVVTLSADPVTPRDETPFLKRIIVGPLLWRFFGGGYADMQRMEALLAMSESEWTVIRPPQLTDKPATGKYRTAVGQPLPRAMKISRADLAAAALEVSEDAATIRQVVAVAY